MSFSIYWSALFGARSSFRARHRRTPQRLTTAILSTRRNKRRYSATAQGPKSHARGHLGGTINYTIG